MTNKDTEAIETIYNIVEKQYELNIQSSQTLHNRSTSIIGFIGVILNIELLSLVRIFTQTKIPDALILLLVSCILLIISLGFAIKSYTGKKFHTINPKKFYNAYKTNTKDQILDDISNKLSDYIDKNRKTIRERNLDLNYALYSLILAIFLVVIFIVDNVLILI